MKKFIVTADIHLWMRSGVPEEWQRNRYLLLFDTLIGLCKEHDAALIIAGDLFEKAEPELEEQQLAFLFFRMLREEGVKVYAVSGNHETLAMGDPKTGRVGRDTYQYLDMGSRKTVDVLYGHCLNAWYEDEQVSIDFLNHCDLSMREEPDNFPVPDAGWTRILISHFRCNYNQFVREEIDVAKLLEPYDLCIAGDIHDSFQDGKLIYTNTPVNKEFQRVPHCGVLLLTLVKGKGSHKVERIPLTLPALIEMVCTTEDELPELNDRDFYRVKVSGRQSELREFTLKAPNVEVKKSIVTEDVLAEVEEKEELKDEPLEAELVMYMREGMSLSEQRITRMLEVFA